MVMLFLVVCLYAIPVLTHNPLVFEALHGLDGLLHKRSQACRVSQKSFLQSAVRRGVLTIHPVPQRRLSGRQITRRWSGRAVSSPRAFSVTKVAWVGLIPAHPFTKRSKRGASSGSWSYGYYLKLISIKPVKGCAAPISQQICRALVAANSSYVSQGASQPIQTTTTYSQLTSSTIGEFILCALGRRQGPIREPAGPRGTKSL